MSDHLDRVEAFLDLHAQRRGHDVITSLAVGDGSTVELTQVLLRKLLADAKQLRAQGTEYGIRAEWFTGLRCEGSVAETLGDALRALDEFDARHGDRLVGRELVERPVGEWRKVGGDRG